MLFTLDYRTIKFSSKASDNMTRKSMFTRSVCNFPPYFQLSNHTSMQPCRASDISRKKNQNFTGFSRANSRKNRPILRDFRGKKVKIRGKIGRSRGKRVKIRRKIGRFRGILAQKSQISKDFQGQILRKIGRFHGKFRGETSPRNDQRCLTLFF